LSFQHDVTREIHEHPLALDQIGAPFFLESPRIDEGKPPRIFRTTQALNLLLATRRWQFDRTQSRDQTTVRLDGF
jgi:hypothetical protein